MRVRLSFLEELRRSECPCPHLTEHWLNDTAVVQGAA
jgi:hypothetical protein